MSIRNRRWKEYLYAAGGFVPLADIGSQSSKLSNLYSSGDIGTFVNNLFTFAIALGGVAAVLRLAYAGYLYMGSADMWSTKERAKEAIRETTLGLLLLLAIWLILNQINPDILQLNALRDIKPAQQVQGSGGTNAPPSSTSGSNGGGAGGRTAGGLF